MLQTRIRLDLSDVLGEADPMIYGQYVEHLSPDERCIYGALQDEGSPLADEQGYRLDVIEAVRELDVPVVRWPGGCFADIYHWEDGIGPREQRPVRRNWHWGGLESNRFGTDEFLRWCQRVDTAPYINLNLGTGTLDEAVRWIDYCNGRDLTHEVRLRQQNGREEPYGVKLWGIGNEQWGSWEAGQMNAQEYAARLHNWAQFLRKLDRSAQFLGIGSNAAGDPDWDLTVLKKAGALIDHLTVHMYGHCLRDVTTDEEYYATVTNSFFFEERLQRLADIIDIAATHADKKPRISLDEWNVRHMVRGADGHLTLDRSSPRRLCDALFAAGVFHAMLRHASHVSMGCYVFLLNGNGIIQVGPTGLVKTPLYALFQAYHRYMQGTVLRAKVTTEEMLTAARQERLNETATRLVPYVDVVATRDAQSRTLTLAIINRHRDQEAHIQLEPERFTCHGTADIWEMYDEDPFASNSAENPERVQFQHQTANWSENMLTVRPHSLTLLRVAIEAQN